MILKGEHLAEIGELLHGPEWRRWLAEKLDRSERSIRRYEGNGARIPSDVRQQLLSVIRAHRAELESWERDIAS